MKDKQTQMWIPLYVDKWIFGSTRIELSPPERGVFIDLLVLGAKDNGFIRANETTPFLQVQLAGLLNIPIELLQSTIAKCIEYGKISEPSMGIYQICNWDKYQFTDRYKRQITTSSEKTEQEFQKAEPIRKDKIEQDRIKQDTSGFIEFWKAYPHKVGKDKAWESWQKKSPPLDKCLFTLSWQVKSEQWTKENGQYVPLPATWINQGRWTDISDKHNYVVCPTCGNEGQVLKSHKGPVKCGKCSGAIV